MYIIVIYLVTSGVIATLIHDAVSNPAEVIKQRMQMYNSPYKSVVACMRGVYQSEGIKAFYRSYSTQLVMNLPNQTIHFTTYEYFQNKVSTFTIVMSINILELLLIIAHIPAQS